MAFFSRFFHGCGADNGGAALSFSVTKTEISTGAPYNNGEQVRYQVDIQNTGSAPVPSVTLADSNLISSIISDPNNILGGVFTLPVATTYTAVYEHLVTPPEGLAGTLTNIATASEPGGFADSDSVTVTTNFVNN